MHKVEVIGCVQMSNDMQTANRIVLVRAEHIKNKHRKVINKRDNGNFRIHYSGTAALSVQAHRRNNDAMQPELFYVR